MIVMGFLARNLGVADCGTGGKADVTAPSPPMRHRGNSRSLLSWRRCTFVRAVMLERMTFLNTVALTAMSSSFQFPQTPYQITRKPIEEGSHSLFIARVPSRKLDAFRSRDTDAHRVGKWSNPAFVRSSNLLCPQSHRESF
jgi:hypothetical protein